MKGPINIMTQSYGGDINIYQGDVIFYNNEYYGIVCKKVTVNLYDYKWSPATIIFDGTFKYAFFASRAVEDQKIVIVRATGDIDEYNDVVVIARKQCLNNIV